MFSGARQKAMLSIIVLLTLIVPALSAQEVTKVISLEDGTGAPDYAWGMALAPDASMLYVTVCGTLTNNNNRLLEIDTTSYTLTDEGVTGFYPEEIAFRLDTLGDIELIFVSDSSDGTVTVLNPDLSPHQTIDVGGAGMYPYGLFMGPSGRYLYVTTFSGMGELMVIDTDPGPDYLKVVQTYYHGAANGRMARYQDKLIMTGSDWMQGAYLMTVDLGDPNQAEMVILDPDTSGWPGANDVAVTNDGYAYVTVTDWNFGYPELYEVNLNASPLQISRIIDLSAGGNPYLHLEHGIAASPDGNTLVVTYLEIGVVKMVGRKAGCVLGQVDVELTLSQINDALFMPDGDRVFLTNQTLAELYVLKGVPEHGLYLSGTSETTLGGSVDLELIGGEGGRPGLLLISLVAGSLTFPAFTLDIGLPFYVLVHGPFGTDNRLNIATMVVPNDPAFSNMTFYLQGLTEDGDLLRRPSNLHVLQIL